MKHPAVEKFIQYFEYLDPTSSNDLSDFYDDELIFEDPMHRIEGRKNLVAYFQKLNANLKSGRFTFHTKDVTSHKAYLEWTMEVELKRPSGKKIVADGISVLTFDQKITAQRDYFDAGQMFYEGIPLLGGIIRWIKRKIAG